jgi:hypothetical protein
LLVVEVEAAQTGLETLLLAVVEQVDTEQERFLLIPED